MFSHMIKALTASLMAALIMLMQLWGEPEIVFVFIILALILVSYVVGDFITWVILDRKRENNNDKILDK